MSAVLEQMMKEQQQRPSIVREYMAAVCSTGRKGQEFVTLVNASSTSFSSCMVVDLGCLRSVAGVGWIVQEVQRCRRQGRFVEIQPTQDYFRFGDGARRQSKYRVFLEIGLCGHVGLLAVNAVEYPCPPLLSKVVCSQLGLHLDCGSGRYDLQKLGVTAKQFTTSQGGHFLLSIDSFVVGWPSWVQLRQQGHHPKICHDEIQMFELRKGQPVGKGVCRAPGLAQAQGRRAARAETSRPSSALATDGSSAADATSQDTTSRAGCLLHPQPGARVRRESSGLSLGRGGGDSDRLLSPHSAQVLDGDQAGRIDGECHLGSWGQGSTEGRSGIGGSAKGEGGGQSRPEDDQQEGGQARGDGAECGVSHAGIYSQPRSSPEHELGPSWPSDRAQVEAALLDAASQGGSGGGTPHLASPPSLVGNDVQPGGSGDLGASGRRDPHLVRTEGPSDDALRSNGRSEKTRPWTRGQAQQLKQGIKAVRTAIDHLAHVAQQSPEPLWRVLEIFGGSAALSLVARSTGHWVALEPVDIVYGQDLLDPKQRKLVFQQLLDWEPDLVCLEPPCGPWSSLQNINAKEIVELKRAIHLPFWEFAAQVWRIQDRAGRLVLLEQPLLSAALKLQCMLKREHVHRAVVDQCMFDLRDPHTHRWYRKRTALDVNSSVFAAALMKHAQCTHRPDQHEVIEGKTFCNGQWVNRSLVAGTWTTKFGKHILACAGVALLQAGCWQRRHTSSLAFCFQL